MAMTLSAIVKGVTYSLSDGTYAYWASTSGVGMPAIQRIQEKGPLQHGTTDRGYDIGARQIFLPLFLHGSTLAAVDTMRDNLSQILSPFTDEAIKLRITRDDGEVRQIDAHVHDLVDYPHTPIKERMGPSQALIVSLVAANPFWYDPTIKQYVVSTSVVGLTVPVSVPIVFGTGTDINQATTIPYAGTAPDYPTIYITGPVTSLIITNQTTGDVLDWTGTTISAGTTRTVTLAYGSKTIVDGNGDNKISELVVGSSDFTAWHLSPAPAAVDGNNDILVTGSNATSATEIRMEYYDCFLSL